MKAVLVNYCFTPTWLFDYPEIDYLIYDRSESKEWLKDFPQERIIYTQNIGQVDLDKLTYLVDNYNDLPEVFLWGKTNLFKFINKEEFEKVKDNSVFTPLLTQYHRTYSDKAGVVCYYEDGMYYERNDSWYTQSLDCQYAMNFPEFAKHFHIPCPRYIPFAPGGNYILTKQKVHKYSRDFYDDMRQCLPHCVNPGEAHMCERAYNLIWQG